MNVLFLTTARFSNVEEHAMYPDLLRQFRNHGHNVFTVSTYEKRQGRETSFTEENGIHSLRVKVGNLTKTGFIEKGVSTLLIENQFLAAVKKYLTGVRFDLVMYSTPPITLVKVVEYIRKRDGARSYLLLKDIFPQNAVDIGLLTTTGIKGIIYKYFRAKEKRLYAVSDTIGCMSQGNVDYVLKHNSEIFPTRVEICPNTIEVQDMRVNEEERQALRNRYGIPLDKKVFVYGGNLGKPQGIPFLIECLRECQNIKDAFFLIVGDGTEYGKIEAFINEESPKNSRLMKRLPKEDYDRMIASCDIGMVFLDHRFSIPNFPSRLLSYMQAGLPILACTDPNTDVGKVITEGNFGWWCESNDTENFRRLVERIISEMDSEYGKTGLEYLQRNYSENVCYDIIMRRMSNV